MRSFYGISCNPRYQQDDASADPEQAMPRLKTAYKDAADMNIDHLQYDINHDTVLDVAQDTPDDQEPILIHVLRKGVNYGGVWS